MANPDSLGSITFEAETLWAEIVTTFTTTRPAIVAPVDCSKLVHNKSPAEYTEQYRGAGHRPFLGPQGGSFSMKLDLGGHGSTMVGSPTISALETLLGRVWGNVALSAAASTTLTGGTANVPLTTASGTFSAGGLCRVGSLNSSDGGSGQMYPIATHVTTSLTLLADLRGTPVNGAVLYPVVQLYPSSSPVTSAVTGTRFQLLTANGQYNCHGCWPMSVAITGLSAGERPQLEITWGVSRWTDTSAVTFPSAVATARNMPSPIAAGSLQVNAVGTVTRNELVYRNLTIEYTLGIEPQKGPGGVGAYQDIVGAARTGAESCKVSFTVDAGAAGVTTLADWGRSEVDRFVMWTGSTTDGKAIGIKLPKVCSETVPVQIRDGGINRVRFDGMAYCSDTLTNDLTRALFVLGLA